MPIAATPNAQLEYERTGHGPPLLLIMGMSGTLLTWGEPFMELLRPHFDTIVYNHRGVGVSTRVEAPFTIRDLADDAAALLDALDIETAHVVGISMGGMAAQELAINHGHRLRTLVLGCTYCGGPGSSRASEEVWQRISEAVASGDRARALRVAWEANVSESYAANAEGWARFEEIPNRMRVAVPVIMRQAAAILGHDTSARLKDITAPTLVIHGTEDQMVPVSNGHMIAERIPSARLEILEGIGHLFFWEQPEVSAALVREHTAAAAAAGQ